MTVNYVNLQTVQTASSKFDASYVYHTRSQWQIELFDLIIWPAALRTVRQF